MSGSIWGVSYGSPKTKSSFRTIPLIPKAVQLLKQIKAKQAVHKNKIGAGYSDNDLVFCSSLGTPLWQAHVRRTLNYVMEEVGVDGIHIHCLRHTFATRGLENGIELKVMQEILGHASISMTADLYTHVLPDKKAEAIQKLDCTIQI